MEPATIHMLSDYQVKELKRLVRTENVKKVGIIIERAELLVEYENDFFILKMVAVPQEPKNKQL